MNKSKRCCSPRTAARASRPSSRTTGRDGTRCISSQAGCGLGCTFCATGAVGLIRNLTADEIVAQVMHPRWTRAGLPRPASVAFMGMGEALANPHVFDALTLLTDQAYAGMSARRITVSTVGFAPNLERLVNEHPQVTITLGALAVPEPAQADHPP